MAKVNVNSQYKDIIKLLKYLTGSKNLWEVLNDFITLSACSIHNSFEVNKERWNRREKIYMDIIHKYTKEETDIFPQILSEVVNLLENNPYQDLFGELYMQLDFGEKSKGQVFTPYNVSYMMSKLSYDDISIKKEIKKKGFITLQEPAIGGGGIVISFCEVLAEHNINYQRNLIVIGQDLSQTAALMSYVILSLLGISAVIKIGSTLSDPYVNYRTERKNNKDIWITPMFAVNNCFDKV